MSFDLGAMLKDVSNLDTIREQIEYIRLDRIDADPNNFYKIDGIEDLASNIELCGLQQPIRVRQNPDDPERYVIVSGHRRRAALELLAKDDPERWAEIQCIVERDTVSPALQQLRLIYANSNTRTMTSAELGEQAAQVEKLLYQLKDEGYKFPGRMRDHVAEAVNASKTKLARLKVIRENLAGCWMPYYKDNTIAESAAYELSHMPKEWQELIYAEKKSANENLRCLYESSVKQLMQRFSDIEKITCEKSGGAACQNKYEMRRYVSHGSNSYYWSCSKCCEDCDKLTSCKYACPLLADKIKQLKAEKREERRQENQAAEEKVRPVINYIQGVYERVGKARQAASVSVKDLYKAQERFYAETDDQKQADMESGAVKFSENTTLPFGYSFYYRDAQALCSVADLLGCSVDYLLGRNVPDLDDVLIRENVLNSDTTPATENVSNSNTWHNGTPNANGEYIALVRYTPNGKLFSEIFRWDDGTWIDDGISLDEVGVDVVFWSEIPREKSSPLNHSCITGLSPSGHCGSAECCDKEYTCCLQCDDPCNSRCGFIEDSE